MESQNQNTKNALCYVPFVAFILFFTESNKSDAFLKHIKYGVFIFFAYLLLWAIIGRFFGGFLTLLYLGISAFLFYKAYNGEKVELEQIDEFEEIVKEKINETKNK